jgi:hypothetical protein
MNNQAPRRVLATWSSRGGKWCAELIKGTHGYELRELKNGSPCGCAFRPGNMFKSDADAIQWASEHVKSAFDVAMRRTT